MVMEVSITGRHNGMVTSSVARHYDTARLPARYRPKAKKPKVNRGAGTARPGTANGNATLTVEQVYEIREKCKTQSCRVVAEEYGLTTGYCYKISRRIAWAHLTERSAS